MDQHLDNLASLLWSPDNASKSFYDDLDDSTSSTCASEATQPNIVESVVIPAVQSLEHQCIKQVSGTSRGRSPLRLRHNCSVIAVCPTYPSYNWNDVVAAGVRVDVITKSSNAGKIFQHCVASIERFRQSLGGSLAVFKIGITANIPGRFTFYKEDGFQAMTVLHITDSLEQVEMLEAGLIHAHQSIMGCYNILSGGDGCMKSRNYIPPYFCYICGARADTMAPKKHK